jgi:transporter family-2 protein
MTYQLSIGADRPPSKVRETSCHRLLQIRHALGPLNSALLSTIVPAQPRPARQNPMTPQKPVTQTLRTTDLLAAFLSGGLLTLMIHFNGQLAHYGSPLFSSWAAHGTGTVAAVVFLALLSRRGTTSARTSLPAPAWAYLGGLAGAVTVMLSGVTVNTALALSGTLALGLVGQVVFSLVADRWGLFGLPRKRPSIRDIGALGLILAGSFLIIFFGQAGT